MIEKWVAGVPKTSIVMYFKQIMAAKHSSESPLAHGVLGAGASSCISALSNAPECLSLMAQIFAQHASSETRFPSPDGMS